MAMNTVYSRTLRSLVLVSGLIAGTAAAFEPNPFELELEGRLYRGWVSVGLTGTQALVHRGDNRWRMELNARGPLIRMHERADFRWENGELVPENYRYELEAPFENATRRVLYQPEQNRIRAIVDDRVTDHSYRRDWYDPMSYLLLLLRDVTTGAEESTYQVVDRHSAREYHFERVRDRRVSEETVVWSQIQPRRGTTYTLIDIERGLPTHFLRWDGDDLEQQIRAVSARIDSRSVTDLEHWPDPRREAP